jgi:hypothetical protein
VLLKNIKTMSKWFSARMGAHRFDQNEIVTLHIDISEGAIIGNEVVHYVHLNLRDDIVLKRLLPTCTLTADFPLLK